MAIPFVVAIKLLTVTSVFDCTSPRSSPIDQRNLRNCRMFTVHHEHPVRKIDPLMCDVLAIALLVHDWRTFH